MLQATEFEVKCQRLSLEGCWFFRSPCVGQKNRLYPSYCHERVLARIKFRENTGRKFSKTLNFAFWQQNCVERN